MDIVYGCICPEHGEFSLRVRDHINGRRCPECEWRENQGRRSLEKHLADGLVFSSEIPLSFVAVDFEKLTEDNLSACSIGLVKYIDGQIEDCLYNYIKPPLVAVEGKKPVPPESNGGLTYEDVVDAPTMAELMPSIENFVGNLPLVAHSCATERNCFKSAIDYWNIQTYLDYMHFLDTQYISEDIERIFGKSFKGKGTHTLPTVCYRLGIPQLEHHHADYDAEMCGDILLRLAKIQRGEVPPVFMEGFPPSEKKAEKNKYKIKRYDDSIVATIAPELISDNPFKGKEIVLSCFSESSHDIYKQQLLNLGATVLDYVRKKTDLLIYGQEEGHTKKDLADKYGIPKMPEEEFLLIVKQYE